MNQFALRMNVVGEYCEVFERLSAFLSKHCSTWLIVREKPEENDHLHLFMQSEKKVQALRSAFVRAFSELKGNEAYSLKECSPDYDDYLKYMCKGSSKDEQPVVAGYQGLDFGPDKFFDLHEAYWETNAMLNSTKRRKLEAAVRGTVVEQVEAACKAAGVLAYDREGIAKQYIRIYKGLKKPISIYHAKSVVNTVSVILDGGVNQEDILAADIAAR